MADESFVVVDIDAEIDAAELGEASARPGVVRSTSWRIGRAGRTQARLLAAVPVDELAPVSPWQARYRAALITLDLLSACVAIVVALALRPNSTALWVDFAFIACFPLGWIAMLGANRAYERRTVGAGSAEFESVLRSFVYLAIGSGCVFYLFHLEVARGLLLITLGLTAMFTLLSRFAARKSLHRRRRSGTSMTPIVAVGGVDAAASFAQMLHRDRHAGMKMVGLCLPDKTPLDAGSERRLQELDVEVMGDVDDIVGAVQRAGASTVAVLSGEVSADKLRWISWQLEGTPTALVVSPGLAEFGGRRMHLHPVAGLPLLHIEVPTFSGFRRTVKLAFDRVVAGLALIFLAPILLTIAVVVRATSPGPALFKQIRVGRNGREFRMIKFRSMVVDAEQRRLELVGLNENDGLLFKIREDPRVTKVGRLLRRFSLDELPQLFNVLGGSMSLVGPRPPLPDEVALYQDDVRRRLLVKPGLTGLWQVSGRSDLSWEESVRLDLRYVEDWSLSLDLAVLWKTARAVVRSDGAY